MRPMLCSMLAMIHVECVECVCACTMASLDTMVLTLGLPNMSWLGLSLAVVPASCFPISALSTLQARG